MSCVRQRHTVVRCKQHRGVSSILLIFGGRQSPPRQGGCAKGGRAKSPLRMELAVLNLSEWSSCAILAIFMCFFAANVGFLHHVKFHQSQPKSIKRNQTQSSSAKLSQTPPTSINFFFFQKGENNNMRKTCC